MIWDTRTVLTQADGELRQGVLLQPLHLAEHAQGRGTGNGLPHLPTKDMTLLYMTKRDTS